MCVCVYIYNDKNILRASGTQTCLADEIFVNKNVDINWYGKYDVVKIGVADIKQIFPGAIVLILWNSYYAYITLYKNQRWISE